MLLKSDWEKHSNGEIVPDDPLTSVVDFVDLDNELILIIEL